MSKPLETAPTIPTFRSRLPSTHNPDHLNFHDGILADIDTADINGDIYFDLRTRGLPLECGPWINQSFWSRLDCVNSEVNVDPSTLAITKIILEVDTRYCILQRINLISCEAAVFIATLFLMSLPVL